MVLSIWFHTFSLNDEVLISIKRALTDAGITIRAFQFEDDPGPGLVFIDQNSNSVCEFISRYSRSGNHRVLVIMPFGTDLAKQEVWQLLEAGASDVFAWEEGARAGEVILSRLQRWHEVDKLVESPVVRKNLVGQSRLWRSVLRQLVEVACFTDSPVLLMGESGTGKELAARLIHALDRTRNQHELVIIDCTTIVPELSGSELFGHERGAFTSAVSAREGAFALVDGGTLFLDEVGELPLGLQVQLLRVLQEGTYKRVGSNTWRHSNFRLICATNRDLHEEVEQGGFRRDLYYRLAVWPILLPPLRQRTEDIPLLINHFWQQAQLDSPPPVLDEHAQSYFLARDYPGNVRDLKNLVSRIATRHVGPGPVTVGDIPPDERPPLGKVKPWCDQGVEQALRRALASGVDLETIKQAIRDVTIRIAVDEANKDLTQASARLGVSRRTVEKWRVEQRVSGVNGVEAHD